MGESLNGSDLIRDAISLILENDAEEPHMIGGLVVLAEMMGPDGDPYLFRLSSDDLPIWREQGMLTNRLDTLSGRMEDDG